MGRCVVLGLLTKLTQSVIFTMSKHVVDNGTSKRQMENSFLDIFVRFVGARVMQIFLSVIAILQNYKGMEALLSILLMERMEDQRIGILVVVFVDPGADPKC